MPIKHYPEIAAARHMKTAAGPMRVPAAKTDNPTTSKRAQPACREDPARRAKPGRVKTVRSAEYRRQRLIALSLVVLTFLAVPTLVTLLILFG